MIKKNPTYNDLCKWIRREDVCLFIGSGCSLASNAPSANILANILTSLLPESFQKEVEGKGLSGIAEAMVLSDNKRTRLNKVLYENFTNLKPNNFHKTLARIPHIKTLITTNYDNLIEQAYWQDYFQVLCTDDDICRYNSKCVKLFKIHGDCGHLDDIVISDSDYRQFLSSPKHQLLWNAVLHELATKHTIFVGYSLEDWNILNLIDKIRKTTTPKEMYLISPKLTQVQISRLSRYEVKHIKCDGCEFLDTLLSDLKYSFGDDVYNNVTSNETLNRFALVNDIIPTFENDGVHTNIKSYKSATLTPLNLKLNFSSKDPNLSLRRESITFKQLIDGFEIPAIKLKDDELSTFEIIANGLKVNSKDNIKDVILAPFIEDVQLGFVSESLGLKLKKMAKKYSSDGKVICCLNTPVFNAEFKFNAKVDPMTCQINVRVNDSFSDIEEGILWLKTLIGLLEADDMQLWINHLKIGSLSDIHDSECLTAYKLWLEYCENIKEIELRSGSFFEKYEGFSIQSYEFSKIIKAYLTQTQYIDKPNIRNQKFTLNIPKGNDFSSENTYLMRTVTEISEPIVLCGTKFIIPEERLLMLECKVKLIDNSKTEYNVWEVENISNKVQYEYCDRNKPDNIIDNKN